jgi:hypothetical protein
LHRRACRPQGFAQLEPGIRRHALLLRQDMIDEADGATGPRSPMRRCGRSAMSCCARTCRSPSPAGTRRRTAGLYLNSLQPRQAPALWLSLVHNHRALAFMAAVATGPGLHRLHLEGETHENRVFAKRLSASSQATEAHPVGLSARSSGWQPARILSGRRLREASPRLPSRQPGLMALKVFSRPLGRGWTRRRPWRRCERRHLVCTGASSRPPSSIRHQPSG